MKWRRALRHLKLGDAVASVAQPLARAIDAVAGTDIQNCRGCAARKEVLNQLTQPSTLTPPRFHAD